MEREKVMSFLNTESKTHLVVRRQNHCHFPTPPPPPGLFDQPCTSSCCRFFYALNTLKFFGAMNSLQILGGLNRLSISARRIVLFNLYGMNCHKGNPLELLRKFITKTNQAHSKSGVHVELASTTIFDRTRSRRVETCGFEPELILLLLIMNFQGKFDAEYSPTL